MRISVAYILAEVPVLFITIAVAAVLYLWNVSWVIWAVVYFGTVFIWSFSQAVKYILRVKRPKGSYLSGFAFPSSHSTFMLSISFLLLPVSVSVGVVLLLLGVLSSYARVRVGVHRAYDMLGSFFISVFGVFFVQFVISSIV